ncbi:hypothetical protein WKI68_43765 [Streptomyces sp. MS1.HAVA.3]|uniref:Major facilitator superfamily (MFS) profile domain-containing protein n=1 Tax=Streptomyces caledonius TaxID=3134107 RepID=A0ABU8UEI5_9ACTN
MRAESSAAARRTGAFVAVAVALLCIQLDFFALNLAIPGIAAELGVTVSAAQWTLSAYMLAIGCFFIVGGRVGTSSDGGAPCWPGPPCSRRDPWAARWLPASVCWSWPGSRKGWARRSSSRCPWP